MPTQVTPAQTQTRGQTRSSGSGCSVGPCPPPSPPSNTDGKNKDGKDKTNKAKEAKWIKEWTPKSDNGNLLAEWWAADGSQSGQNDTGDYWTGAMHGDQHLCFGREACHQAFVYYKHTGDLAGAKKIAAEYCLTHDCVNRGAYSEGEFDGAKIESESLGFALMMLADAPFAEDVEGTLAGDCFSFDPSTEVLLANGKTKPISELKVGDKVESADPATGKESGSRTIQRIWINHDTDLLDATVTDGHGHTSVLHTTASHPFYDATTHMFTRADDLKAGDHLATTKGHKQPTVVKDQGHTRSRQPLQPHRPAAPHVLCTGWYDADLGPQCGIVHKWEQRSCGNPVVSCIRNSRMHWMDTVQLATRENLRFQAVSGRMEATLIPPLECASQLN